MSRVAEEEDDLHRRKQFVTLYGECLHSRLHRLSSTFAFSLAKGFVDWTTTGSTLGRIQFCANLQIQLNQTQRIYIDIRCSSNCPQKSLPFLPLFRYEKHLKQEKKLRERNFLCKHEKHSARGKKLRHFNYAFMLHVGRKLPFDGRFIVCARAGSLRTASWLSSPSSDGKTMANRTRGSCPTEQTTLKYSRAQYATEKERKKLISTVNNWGRKTTMKQWLNNINDIQEHEVK